MKKHIPKHKSDIEAIVFLNSSTFDDIKSDVPRLLELIQDLNWDVARDVGKYLTPYVNEIKDELIFILNSDDDEWKFGVMVALIGKYQNKLDKDLILTLNMISESPTKVGEISEEVVEMAREILSDNLRY